MNIQLKYDQKDNREHIETGLIDQHISIFIPDRFEKIRSGKGITIFYGDDYLFDAEQINSFRLRFYKRITNLPFIVDSNRYMTKDELLELSKRSGYKDHNQFYMTMSKLYGKYLSKETFIVVRFKRIIE
jgi:hypothetical protein